MFDSKGEILTEASLDQAGVPFTVAGDKTAASSAAEHPLASKAEKTLDELSVWRQRVIDLTSDEFAERMREIEKKKQLAQERKERLAQEKAEAQKKKEEAEKKKEEKKKAKEIEDQRAAQESESSCKDSSLRAMGPPMRIGKVKLRAPSARQASGGGRRPDWKQRSTLGRVAPSVPCGIVTTAAPRSVRLMSMNQCARKSKRPCKPMLRRQQKAPRERELRNSNSPILSLIEACRGLSQ